MTPTRAEQAFSDYAVARRPHLFRMAAAMLGDDPADAEDLVQAALIRLARRWRSTQEPDAYVRKVLVNLVIDRSRRRSARPRTVPWSRDDPGASHAGDPAIEVTERLSLTATLAALPTRQRQVLVLRYLDGCSEAEIAALLGLSPGTVKSHAHRGLSALRALLAPTDVASRAASPTPTRGEDR